MIVHRSILFRLLIVSCMFAGLTLFHVHGLSFRYAVFPFAMARSSHVRVRRTEQGAYEERPRRDVHPIEISPSHGVQRQRLSSLE